MRAGAGCTQAGLELGPGLLDRVEVRGVGREIAVAEPGVVERVADRRSLVRRQVVHDDEGIRPMAQGRHQHLLGKGQEHRCARCDGDAHRRHHAVQGQGADHGQSLPVAMRDLADSPLPARGRPCREFRVWAGMMGAKEPRHAATQRAEDPRRPP